MKPHAMRVILGVGFVVALSGCALFGRYEITLTVSPAEGGTVTMDPDQGPYGFGKRVTLTATPAQGYAFASYAGDFASTTASSTVVMTANKAITAVFSTDQWVAAADPSSAGTVQVVRKTNARATFPVVEKDILELLAIPASGWEFSRWTGDVTGTTNPTDLTVTGLFNVTALFGQTVSATNTYGGSGSEGYQVPTTGRSVVSYSLNLGASARNVCFVFTNTGGQAADFPTVTEVSGSFGLRLAPPLPKPESVSPSRPVALRGKPQADAFYPEAAAIRARAPRIAPRGVAPAPLRDTVGGPSVTFFYDSTTSNTISATCRAVIADASAGVALNVYVADLSWGTGTGQVTQSMVDGLAAKFLDPASANDIYAWETNIFGAEWGATGLGAADIPPTNPRSITILLYDVDGDGTAFLTQGGVVGFFWAKDNFTHAAVPYSNERIMFYLDAPMLAQPDGQQAWAIAAPWPQEVISTLAHEFQHMIHYYQKDIILNGSDLTGANVWLNEMCSMVAEDFLSDKIGVPGPRGVDPTITPAGSAGSAHNTRGYLPIYNYLNDTPVAYWPPQSASIDVLLASYATNYAFGAYLARNFGGTTLFRDMVQSPYVGRTAIDHALLASADYAGESFASTLAKWGIANLLSDSMTAGTGFVYNTGGWITSAIAGTTYNLGSIDLFAYDYTYSQGSVLSGPWIWTSIPATQQQTASSSWYYAAAKAATGTLAWTISLEKDTRLEVIVRP